MQIPAQGKWCMDVVCFCQAGTLLKVERYPGKKGYGEKFWFTGYVPFEFSKFNILILLWVYHLYSIKCENSWISKYILIRNGMGKRTKRKRRDGLLFCKGQLYDRERYCTQCYVILGTATSRRESAIQLPFLVKNLRTNCVVVEGSRVPVVLTLYMGCSNMKGNFQFVLWYVVMA